MLKKIPYGISNYEKLIDYGYYYVDKTKYIEVLENLNEPNIMFLRPRKFGKTLFTSTLECYYDVKKADKFEALFGETYIGKNPTSKKNSYYILKFNFSGIDTTSLESTIKSFKNRTIESIKRFTEKYSIDFYVNTELDAEELLNSLFTALILQKVGSKIYVIIDEYDHFANELLGFDISNFKNLVSKNGKVRKWYEILKEGTESIVDKIFITGVAPITLDSLTSGFNISRDLTRDFELNSMMGFTKEELVKLMEEQGIPEKARGKILPIMKENYDGYRFSIKSKEGIYNSNMCLYFLNEYAKSCEVPEELIDLNIASDYNKLGNMLNLCTGENRQKIMEQTILGENVVSKITGKFNPEIEFTEEHMVSMMFYLGYLTIVGDEFGVPVLGVPNKVVKEIYSDYFMRVLFNDVNYGSEAVEIRRELAFEGKITKYMALVHKYLNNLSNRDYIKFDEKYVKLIAYCIAMNLGGFWVKSEVEVNRKYPDLLITPREENKGYCNVMIEFKYLKKEDESKLEEVKQEGKEQLQEYLSFEEIKKYPNLKSYVVVSVNDELYVEEVK